MSDLANKIIPVGRKPKRRKRERGMDVHDLSPCEKTQLLQDHETDILNLKAEVQALKRQLQTKE